MKKSEIKVGGIYAATVSGNVTAVRVEAVRSSQNNNVVDRYEVTNLKTGRKTTFKSAQKFRRELNADQAPIMSELEADLKHLASQGAAGSISAEQQDQRWTNRVSLAASLRAKTATVTPPHLIIEARAGTGKTTTLVEGLKRIKGMESPFTPSPQQAAIWESMEASRDAKTICFVAFNKSIATELQRRVPAGCDAMTMHSMGFRAVQNSLGRQRPVDYVTIDTISEITGRDSRELNKYDLELVKATESLVSLCKVNLLGWDGSRFSADSITDDDLIRLSSEYDVENTSGKVFEWVRGCLARMISPSGRVSFDDMIWLPVVLKLNVPRYDLLLVDEAQDLNRCQQALAKKAGKRLILCGDPKQAIYGFAGADSKSMARMAEELGSADQGCVILPLTVTRRCGRAIVAEANKYVADFSAHESNGEGKVSEARYPTDKEGRERPGPHYTEQVQDGDMILSRVNAPLVRECFRFLKMGRKAEIQGRSIGQGLITTIKKLNATDVADLAGKLSDWKANETRKENAKRNPSRSRLMALEDRYECLQCFVDSSYTVEGVVKKIEEVFTAGHHCPTCGKKATNDDQLDCWNCKVRLVPNTGIKLSSIHRAKGLEAERVFFIRGEVAPCPHPMAKTASAREQEQHLLYVATTRAISELIYVS